MKPQSCPRALFQAPPHKGRSQTSIPLPPNLHIVVKGLSLGRVIKLGLFLMKAKDQARGLKEVRVLEGKFLVQTLYPGILC